MVASYKNDTGTLPLGFPHDPRYWAYLSPAGLARYASRGRWLLARHLSEINRKLLDVAARRILRLMVFLPPRHGKSELISRYFPAWYVGRFPDRRIILTSYEADIAASWGRKARDVVDEFGEELFGVKLRPSSQAANWWEIAGHEGAMYTAGVAGPISGKGADVAIIDDPLKNDAEARSPSYREHTWEWFNSTLYSRLEPQGAIIILIMTRWHEDDLGGRLLKQMEQGGEQWEVVKLPALALQSDPLGRQPGDPLWPERFDLAALENIKSSIGAYYWSALYQQEPIPAGGYLASASWFEVVDVAPVELKEVRAWDMAATVPRSGSDPDWTAGCKIGKTPLGVYHITDIVRFRGTPLEVEQAVKHTAQLDGRHVPIFMEQEGGASGVSIADHYRREVLNGFNVHFIPATGSKELRVAPLFAQAEAGNVKLVNGHWVKLFLDEVIAFPLGLHDDQVDAASLAFTQLEQLRTHDYSHARI